ncbi:MAG: RidA family protein [Gemmatimonadetes bacterium]|nr:RidA family protein [Gemmatimonadota bacterium]
MTFRVVNPEALGSPRGWNNGMLAPEGGRVLFVAGQIGVEGGPTLAGQFRAALANVARVVKAAGGAGADVGRLTIYVTDMEAYRRSLREIGAGYRAVFGKHFPAMALVAVTDLVDSRAVVEIEATAVIPQACPDGVLAGRDTASEEQR